MKSKNRNLLAAIAVLCLLYACCPAEEKTSADANSPDSSISDGLVIADTIIYDVIVSNPNPEDVWTEDCLKSLNMSTLIDELFEKIYSEEMIAYDFYTHTAMRVSDVQYIESAPEFSREKIGKIQFSEKWILSEGSQEFQKEIISMVLGYELYNTAGEVRGYRPIFKLYLK